MKEARYYKKLDNKSVICELCPHLCELHPGITGICKVRTNIDGTLYSNNYEKITAVNFDPIEKKPLFHFHPGKNILSIGSNGCNMKCECCQNWEIAHTSVKNYHGFKEIETHELLSAALSRKNNIGIAFTYNEPVVWYEYILEMAGKVKEAGMLNVMVTNGYINEKPLAELKQLIDAYNVDIKAFTEEKYRAFAHTGLEPVLKTIKAIVTSGKHIELTNLVVPGVNDDEETFSAMVDWIEGELGNETILHLSRYFPGYRMKTPPTSPEKLRMLYEMASEKLKYVYLGNINIEGSQDTFCSKCHNRVISRKGYANEIIAVDKTGKCGFCGNKILPHNI